MLAQYFICNLLGIPNLKKEIRNVVFMGMGEPLNNYDNVRLAVNFMIDSRRFALAGRHVTISTVGVVQNMARMTSEIPSVRLALSLHAPNQVCTSINNQTTPLPTHKRINPFGPLCAHI